MSVLYCSVLSLLYVASLYVLVPARVRKLERDHPTHIQRRCIATLSVSFLAIVTFPWIFCGNNEVVGHGFSFWRLLFHPMGTGGTGTGDSNNNNNNSIPLLGVWFHTVILYTGPIVASLVRTYEIRSQSMARRGNTTTRDKESSSSSYPMTVWRRLVDWNLRPLLFPTTNAQKWIQIRNFIVAPWTEEIIFRGCMVPVLLLLATSTPKMTPLQVSIIAPLFFGFAHVHHAAQRWSKGDGLMKVIVLQTLFQFAYTFLFGWYSAHALIRTGSVLAVTLSHSYCNFMGLPDISIFLAQPGHVVLYQKYPRILIGVSYIVGIVGFYYFLFSSDLLLPLPPHLVAVAT